MTEEAQNYADVLIVCGQGTYEDGCFYGESADRDVYLGHAVQVQELVERFRYSHVVLSGGYTQARTPHLSEAESLLGIWDDADSNPAPDSRLMLDIHALDSAENIFMGLIAARSQLGRIPIRRIGVSCAWRFEKARFTHVAAALGIADRFYFHGHAGAEVALFGDEAVAREQAFLAEVGETGDVLLLDEAWERRRFARYHGGDYLERLSDLVPLFPAFFQALLDVRVWGMEPRLVVALQQSFQDEIVKPYQGD